jgi:rhodanese-related sulfurtransferase
MCADNIVLGNKQKYHGAINTAIVKVFDMTVATAGTASKHLTNAKIEHIVSTTHNGSHAGYYPGAKQMSIQIAFSPNDGQLLSAQIAGYDGVDKRIDILSSAIKRKSTIYELLEFEHAYAPPFSSAKDPVNIAAFVAENILLEKHKIYHWNDIENRDDNSILLDVRNQNEFDAGYIPNAIHIPLDSIRERINELDKSQKIYIYCHGGQRGYLAQQILAQHGFNTINLSGGYQLWNNCTNEILESKNLEMKAQLTQV